VLNSKKGILDFLVVVTAAFTRIVETPETVDKNYSEKIAIFGTHNNKKSGQGKGQVEAMNVEEEGATRQIPSNPRTETLISIFNSTSWLPFLVRWVIRDKERDNTEVRLTKMVFDLIEVSWR
jgi:hypothetical protein